MFDSMPTTQRRTLIASIVSLAIAAGIAVVLAFSSESPQSSTPLSSPGSEIATPVTETSGTLAAPSGFQRALNAPGTFDCNQPGLWKPYASSALVIAVGEPPRASTCTSDVAILPQGYCSSAACSEVPSNWEIRVQSGVPLTTLALLVAPVDAANARMYCYRNLVVTSMQLAPINSIIEQVCPTLEPDDSPTTDSIDIVFVPPSASVDVPPLPPTASIDIPKG
jgi:hypothetical protein